MNKFGVIYNYVNEGCEIYSQFLDGHGFDTREEAERHLRENVEGFFGPGSQATVVELTPETLATIPHGEVWPGPWLRVRGLSQGETATYLAANSEVGTVAA